LAGSSLASVASRSLGAGFEVTGHLDHRSAAREGGIVKELAHPVRRDQVRIRVVELDVE
jgi:hypothetical protein